MPGELIVTAADGVRWKRDIGATSTPAQLFAAMQQLTADWHERQWNWWRDGQIEAEEKLAKHEHEAARLVAQVGDADDVADRHGDLPPDRRTWHLSGLLTFTTSSGILPSDGRGNHHDPG
jgi:hypothetical protein